MPPKTVAHVQRLRALAGRTPTGKAPADAATPRIGPRRTSTPLEAATAVAVLGDVDMVRADSPTIEMTSDDSAEASTEETEHAVCATATGRSSGSMSVDDVDNRKRGILSQTSAFASQASSPVSKRIRFVTVRLLLGRVVQR
jgi:hypothetical protein